ncbi:MAG: TonB-dependent receptor [Gemmatimonadaceae bacterium]
MSRILARPALGALALLFTPLFALSPAVARATSPALFAPPVTGRVQDDAGRPLPNVDVVISEAGRTTTTNAEGRFELRALAAGTYHFNFLLIGYSPAHVVVAVPDSGAPVSVAVTLRAATVRLQGVQVTATPTGTDPRAITQSTVELSGKELSRNLGASVAQTLANEPGMAMRYNGPAANVPVIRGLTGERILVLQDGDRTGDLSSASTDHALSVDPLTAQRIEVVRGPASLLYGNNALGGVVNVISSDIPTSVPTHVAGYVAGQGESVNPGGAGSAGITVPLGSSLAATGRVSARSLADYRIGGGETQFDSYSRNQGAVAGLGYVGDAASGGVVYRGTRFNYGLPTPAGDPEAGGHIEGQRNEGVGRFDLAVNKLGIQTLRLNGSAQWYRHDEVENTGVVGTSFDLKTQTVNATARTQFGPGYSGAVGLSGLFKQYASTGEEALTPAANSTSGGVFVYQEIPLGGASLDLAEARRSHLQVGGRYDVYHIASKAGEEKFGPARTVDFNNVSGSLGASVPVGSALTLSGSIARAFRAPTVEELYSNAFHAAVGTFDVGNPDLKAETNTGVDGVLRAQSGRASAQLSAYYSRINDFISPNIVRDTTLAGEGGGPPNSVPLNVFSQSDATLRGLEGQVETEVVRHVIAGALGDVVRGSFTSGGVLPFLPAARLGGSLRWDDGRFSLGGDVRHGFAQTRVSQPACARADRAVLGADGELPAEASSGTPCVDVPTPAYTVVNLSAGLNLIVGGYVHTLTLRADNVGDERYYDASSRIKGFTANPGRNLSVVYKVLF